MFPLFLSLAAVMTLVKNANRARSVFRGVALRVRELSHPRSFSPCNGDLNFRGNGDKNFARIMSVALARSSMNSPTEFSPSVVVQLAFVSSEGFPPGTRRMDEIATPLDRARVRVRIGYPDVFYFACPSRCYLAPLR